MANQRARQLAIEQQSAKEWDAIRTSTRSATDDVNVRGIGFRRLQVIVCPSFEDSRAWEVRQLEDEWWLYESDVVQSRPTIQLVGYNLISMDWEVLASFFKRIVSLSIPVSPDLSGGGGLDGKVIQLAVFGDLYSEWRFQWWSQSPTHWKPLIDLANEMIESFSAASKFNI